MDPFLIIGSFVAILLLAVFAGKLFPAKDILSEASALTEYHRYEPDAQVETTIVGLDHTTVLLPLVSPNGKLGVVTKLGDKLVCRTLGFGDLSSFTVKSDTLSFSCTDFTYPNTTIRLRNKDMERAKALIDALLPKSGAPNAA